MATLHPNVFPTLRTNAGRYREQEVVECLRDNLPPQFEVFHNVPLHSLNGGRDRYGELDVVILAPDGSLLLMEVKAGPVELRSGDIFKVYSDGECDVGQQGRLQRMAMQNRLHEARLKPAILSCLVLPDYDLGDGQVISVPRERIIDAPRYGALATTVQQWLAAVRSEVDVDALRRLLQNHFCVTPSMDVLRDQLRGTVRQLSDGLATWVPRIEAPSGVFRIQATAGSGKTQLALQLLSAAATEHASAAYICFNRTLADHVRSLAPSRVEVVNFHELCVDHYRRRHGEPDFGTSQAFERVASLYCTESAGMPARLDVLIIDEGQDFDPGWVEALCHQLKPGGKLYLLEDPDQRLYRKPDFELTEAVVINCRDNFRSPRAICDMINALALVPSIRSMNPYFGEAPAVHTYDSDERLLAETQAAIDTLRTRGFALADIAVVTGRGRERSALLNRVQIGPYRTRRFTGEYDRNGEPRWSDGDLLVESVYRYKGQSAPAVVVAEFDFTELDEPARRKLFVALTRAQMTATLVLSSSAERCLLEALG